MPVPYNIGFQLSIMTKLNDDMLQIIEQILPTFTPEYTLSINAVPDMNVKQDIPVILNSVSVSDEYDGDFQTRRFVTHTLNFTLKTSLFGAVSGQAVISQVEANIGLNNITDPNRIYVATGDTATATLSTENWLDGF